MKYLKMEINKIIKRLEDIEKISKFQQKRLKSKAFRKITILEQALDLIGFQILNILKELENQKQEKISDEEWDVIHSNK